MDEGHLDPFRNSDYETKTSQVKSTGFLLSFLNIACIYWNEISFLQYHGNIIISSTAVHKLQICDIVISVEKIQNIHKTINKQDIK